MRGADLAVKEQNGMAGGKKIEFIKVSSDAKPDEAVNATRKVVEQDKVDIMVGPLSGDEGIAVKDYAKTQPNITFINGSSGAQATTLADPAPNFFRFNTEGAQWMVGLGKPALAKGYKRTFLIAEDYAFPYSQVQGFMAELLRQGRQGGRQGLGAAGRQGLRVGDRQDPEGRRCAAGRAGRLRRGELPHPVRAGRRRQADGRRLDHGRPDVLNFKGKRRESLLGTASAGPMADANDAPEWKEFVADYKATFKGGFPSPSLFAYVYYINTKAALDGLDAVKGDLSGNQKATARRCRRRASRARPAT